MGKHYSEELKNEIIAKFFNEGKSLNQNDINHKRGRPKEIDIDYKERYEILKKYQAFIKAQREKK